MSGRVVLCMIMLVAQAFCSPECPAQSWESALVHRDPSTGKLVYTAGPGGHRIPDFSHAGYGGGGKVIPAASVVRTLAPVPEDNTTRIQQVLDSIGALAPGTDGMRGALRLTAGVFEIHGSLRLGSSGVVLRGSGDGADPQTNTILFVRGNSPHQRTAIVAGGGSSTRWKEQVSGSLTTVVDDSLPVGGHFVRVADPSAFAAGHTIIITHPCTAAWLSAIDSGGTHHTEPGAEAGVDVPWAVNSQPIVYNRTVVARRGDTLEIDAPLFNPLVRRLSQATVYRYARTGLRRLIGLEDVRIDIETAGGTDEDHAWNAVEFSLVEDCWITRCTALHFGQAGFVTRTATRMTIDGCSALDPVSVITGERRYNFNMYDASQQILVVGGRTSGGRHDFVSNGASWTSGCVFLECSSSGTYASSEGHRRWSTGFLFDNVVFEAPRTQTVLGLYNRGYYGTSHGWGMAHAVAWRCDAGGGTILVQRPPTGQNYAIGCSGTATGATPPAPFREPEGYIEGTGRNGLTPVSLYRAQLADRLAPVSVADDDPVEGRTPLQIHLAAYPNPCNPSTTVRFTLSMPTTIVLAIYDSIGREVAVLRRGPHAAGDHQVPWDASRLASGSYICRLHGAGHTSAIRLHVIH